MKKTKRNVEEELEAKPAILHQILSTEEVAKQWFQAVADGNEAKVAEFLAADPEVTEVLSVETASSYGWLGALIIFRPSLVMLLLIQAASSLQVKGKIE